MFQSTLFKNSNTLIWNFGRLNCIWPLNNARKPSMKYTMVTPSNEIILELNNFTSRRYHCSVFHWNTERLQQCQAVHHSMHSENWTRLHWIQATRANFVSTSDVSDEDFHSIRRVVALLFLCRIRRRQQKRPWVHDKIKEMKMKEQIVIKCVDWYLYEANG